MESYEDVLNDGVRQLEDAKIVDSKLDAWYFMSYVSHKTRAQFLLHKDEKIKIEEKVLFYDLIKKRVSHIPLQYILKEQEFMGLDFYVSEDVLIPRQDTEILVEEVLKVCNKKSVLDMCTGSGCIIISLAKLGVLTKAEALDMSESALEVAKKNAKRHGVEVAFFQSNMFENVKETYDIIVSNPPYIKSAEIETLMPEVKDYEPRMALDGREDGLAFYRILTQHAKQYLNSDGKVFFEIGCEQAENVCTLLRENGYSNIKVKKDFSGLDRVVSAQVN